MSLGSKLVVQRNHHHVLHRGWSDGRVGVGAAGGSYLCCCLCRRGSSCCDQKIKKEQEETKGLRSGVQRTKNEAAGNVVVFVGFRVEF